MLIGIDLDNTIINYENVYKSLLSKKNRKTNEDYKIILKKKLQSVHPNKWTTAQGEIYGKYIEKAELKKVLQVF